MSRIAAREQARAAASLVVEEAGRVDPEAQGAFWDEIRKVLPIPQPQTTRQLADEPFTDRQSRVFGRTKIPFGKHQGTCVDEIDLNYLGKLCEPQPFILSLKRYLASQRIQQEGVA
jgi:hypothetical protein